MYQPNLTDPRVLKRIKTAYKLPHMYLSARNPRPISKTQIDKFFGQQQHDLSGWLRNILLVIADNHYSKATGKCKEYTMNATGMTYIKQVMNAETAESYAHWLAALDDAADDEYEENDKLDEFDKQCVREFVAAEFGDVLSTFDFKYKDQSGRLWHPFQSVRRVCKRLALTDYGATHNYDISACAATLILQHAQHLGMTDELEHLNEYLQNKSNLRQQIAEDVGLTVRQVKQIINSLFAGARLARHNRCAIYRLLDKNYRALARLQQHPFITGLRADIKKCWSVIQNPPIPFKGIDTGKCKSGARNLPLSPKAKWARYFKLERQVLDAVREHLTAQNIPHLLEHDGWTTKQVLDLPELTEIIRQKTGFSVIIEEEVL